MTEPARAAKAIKQELRKVFPHIKFSVTSERFAMGNAVRIHYTNGVPSSAVEKITDKYQYGHFDMMTDMYEVSNRREDIPQAKWVQVYRKIDPSIVEATKQQIADEYGIDANDEKQWRSKTGYCSDIKVWKVLKETTL